MLSNKYIAGYALAHGATVDEILALPLFRGWVRWDDLERVRIKSPGNRVFTLFYKHGDRTFRFDDSD